MAKAKKVFKPGDAFYVPVGPEHIFDSDPCNKDNCMVNRAFLSWFAQTYGHANCKAKSTNHGIIFEHEGRKYAAVFDTKTAGRIYKYDQTFRNTRSKAKARAAVRPFTVRMMVESSTTITEGPKMSEEAKQRLRQAAHKKPEIYSPRPASKRRELSL